MKQTKKFLSVFLALLMLFSSAPLSGSFGDFFAFEASAAEIANGTCGENLTWVLDDAGTLTISGTGPMYDYESNTAVPWYNAIRDVKNVIIENGVTSIGNFAFSSQDKMESISIPDGVITIGNNSFEYCDALKNIVIPNSVTSIGAKAFYYCSALESVTLSDNLQSLNSEVFNSCEKLKNVTIPDGVTTIDESAFFSCIALESVTIPDTVTFIGKRAFYNCDALTTLTLPDSALTIDYEAFRSCNGISSVIIPNGIVSLDTRAFYACSNLQVYYYGTDENWNTATNGETLSSANVSLMAEGTCDEYLTWVLNRTTGELVLSGEGAMADYNPIYLVPWYDYRDKIKSIVIEDGITVIGEYAFYNEDNLTSVVIPDSVTTLNEGAFCGCGALTTITLPDSITTIGDKVFYSCDVFSNVNFLGTQDQWNNVTIGTDNNPLLNATVDFAISDFGTCGDDMSWEFNKATGVLSIYGYDYMYDYSESEPAPWYDIRDKVKEIEFDGGFTTYIGTYAFSDMVNLEKVTLISYELEIGANAFNNCTSLQEVYYMDTANSWELLVYGKENNEVLMNVPHIITVEAKIYPTCVNIGYEDGWYCIKCNEYVWGGAEIAATGNHKYSTANCISLATCSVCKQTSGEVNPDNHTELTNHDAQAPTFTQIGWDAYETCSDCGYTTYKELSVLESVNGTYYNITWEVTRAGTLTISGTGDMSYAGYETDYEYPWAAYKELVKSIVIEDGITSVTYDAFNNFENLESVTMADSVTEIGDSAFGYCTKLQNIKLSDNLEVIDDGAFELCYSLTNITLPVSLTTIGEYAFNFCSSLESIVIPGGVETIAWGSFAVCDNLTSIEFCEGVTTIEEYAVNDCEKLASVTIPQSVTTIKNGAFCLSDSIQTVYYGGSKSQWNAISIDTDNDALTNATKVFALIDVIPAEDSDGDGYVEIDTAEKLWWFTQQVNGGNNSLNAELTANIDLSGICGEGIGNWTPISNSYSGHFNGQGFIISDLYIESDEQYAGLFGYVRGGTIENVTVTGNVSSTFYSTYDENYNFYDGAAGGVVAHLDGGTVRNCESDVTVTGGFKFGGICGRLSSGIIEDCINRGTIIRDLDSTDVVYYGGVVGYVDGGTVRGCINQGADIVGTGAEIGGIAGQVTEGTVENCINLGNIATTQNTSAGGIAGRIWVKGTVRNCGNYGTVTGADAGGITGFNEGIIEHCWNIASVSGTSENVGPIAGVDREGYGTSTNCYYLSDTETADGGRTAEQFASGQVAYELNGSTTTDESVWKQTLGIDIYPTFTGASVYYNTTKNCDGTILNSGYSNSSENIVIHDLKYTASDNIITETCGYDGCTHSAAATLNAPENAVYYGESNAATITYSDGWCGGELTVTYSGTANDGTEYTGVPVKVGEAVASIMLGDVTASINYTVAKATNEWIEAPAIDGWTYGEDYNDPTATAKFGDYRDLSFSYRVKGTIAWTNNPPSDAGIYEMRARVQASDNWELLETTIEFEIKKATTTVDLFDFTPPENLNICDGLAKEATVTVKEGIEGVGSVTVKYFKGETELDTAPTAVGTYTVKIEVVEGANFFASKDLITDASWTFTFDIADEADHTGITFVSNENGTHNKVCTVCEKVFESEIACSYTVPQKDSTHHWNKCSECDAIDEKIKHNAIDDGDCTTPIHCSVCDVITTVSKSHSFTNACDTSCNNVGCVHTRTITHTPDADDGDCSTPILCAVCDEIITAGKSHNFDNNCDTDCNNVGCNHTRTITHTPNEDDGDCTTPIHCSVCNTITTEGRTTHTGGEATCSAQAKCEVCGTAHGEVNPDNHKHTEIRNAADATYEADGYTGDKYCLDCEQLIEKGTAIPKLEQPTDPDQPDQPTDPENPDDGDGEDDEIVDCDHLCHSDNKLVNFFWKIIRFLQKIFGIEQYCECGRAHW